MGFPWAVISTDQMFESRFLRYIYKNDLSNWLLFQIASLAGVHTTNFSGDDWRSLIELTESIVIELLELRKTTDFDCDCQ